MVAITVFEKHFVHEVAEYVMTQRSEKTQSFIRNKITDKQFSKTMRTSSKFETLKVLSSQSKINACVDMDPHVGRIHKDTGLGHKQMGGWGSTGE